MSWIINHPYTELREDLRDARTIYVPLGNDEQIMLTEIRKATSCHNRNNVTRTMAYYRMYIEHPELEWALLAHLVSRNAGWNITDLKGEWYPHLFSEQDCIEYFRFMERANWLIFQDAFPQLMLYTMSKTKNRNLFHLLPYLHVSLFMQVMWRDFWNNQNKERLATALIINEQHYIEKRVIEKNSFGAPVLSDIRFWLQDLMRLNMILIPALTDNKIALYGQEVHAFPDVYKRVELGKKLYRILFSEHVLPSVLAWCAKTVHSGSRADFFPHHFSPVKGVYIYSPRLSEVWEDFSHPPASIGDWFTNPDILDLLALQEQKVVQVEDDYYKLLKRIENMVKLKKLFFS